MSRRGPVSTAADPTALRRAIGVGSFVVAMLAIFGLNAALAWRAAASGDMWGGISYSGLALLILVLMLRKL